MTHQLIIYSCILQLNLLSMETNQYEERFKIIINDEYRLFNPGMFKTNNLIEPQHQQSQGQSKGRQSKDWNKNWQSGSIEDKKQGAQVEQELKTEGGGQKGIFDTQRKSLDSGLLQKQIKNEMTTVQKRTVYNFDHQNNLNQTIKQKQKSNSQSISILPIQKQSGQLIKKYAQLYENEKYLKQKKELKYFESRQKVMYNPTVNMADTSFNAVQRYYTKFWQLNQKYPANMPKNPQISYPQKISSQKAGSSSRKQQRVRNKIFEINLASIKKKQKNMSWQGQNTNRLNINDSPKRTIDKFYFKTQQKHHFYLNEAFSVTKLTTQYHSPLSERGQLKQQYLKKVQQNQFQHQNKIDDRIFLFKNKQTIQQRSQPKADIKQQTYPHNHSVQRQGSKDFPKGKQSDRIPIFTSYEQLKDTQREASPKIEKYKQCQKNDEYQERKRKINAVKSSMSQKTKYSPLASPTKIGYKQNKLSLTKNIPQKSFNLLDKQYKQSLCKWFNEKIKQIQIQLDNIYQNKLIGKYLTEVEVQKILDHLFDSKIEPKRWLILIVDEVYRRIKERYPDCSKEQAPI